MLRQMPKVEYHVEVAHLVLAHAAHRHRLCLVAGVVATEKKEHKLTQSINTFPKRPSASHEVALFNQQRRLSLLEELNSRTRTTFIIHINGFGHKNTNLRPLWIPLADLEPFSAAGLLHVGGHNAAHLMCMGSESCF
jgi:hypothetical protein